MHMQARKNAKGHMRVSYLTAGTYLSVMAFCLMHFMQDYARQSSRSPQQSEGWLMPDFGSRLGFQRAGGGRQGRHYEYDAQ